MVQEKRCSIRVRLILSSHALAAGPATVTSEVANQSSDSERSSSASTSSSMPTAQPPDAPRLFLDLSAGKHAPLTTAMEGMQADCLQPFDIESDPPFDVLNDTHFRLALRTAASGLLGPRSPVVGAAMQGVQHPQASAAWAQSTAHARTHGRAPH